MKEIILELFSVVIQTALSTYLVILTGQALQKTKYTKKQKIITVFIVLICTILSSTIKSNIPLLNTLLYFSIILSTLLFILKIPIIKSIFITLLSFILLLITELISAYTFIFILNSSAVDIRDNIYYCTLLLSFQCILGVIIIKLSEKLLRKIDNLHELIEKFNKKHIITILIFLAICILPQVILFIINKYNYSVIYLCINTIQISLACFVIFVLLKKTLEAEKAKSDLNISEIHNKTMVGMVDGVRTLKHDYNNIIQALNGYVTTKQYDKLAEHINKVLEECNIVNNYSTIDQEIFNDPAIYGVVGAKVFLAMEKDIKVEFEITSNIKEICFPMPELSRILGILLDNAIEATIKVPNKYIKIEFKFDKRKYSDTIRIINTYDTNIDINLKDIFKKGVSSKEVKSGIGLWEVKKLISKQKNSQIYSSIEGDKFIQTIVVEKLN